MEKQGQPGLLWNYILQQVGCKWGEAGMQND